ncbi:MAG TPA: hypothetical protein VF230_05785 [Acidimicrobiales bacterium]
MGRTRVAAVAACVALVGASCGAITGGSGGDTRRVLVDFNHDEFGASFLNYFPSTIKVHPGDRVQFRQQWTGEAHTVTMGTLVDTLGKPYWDLLDPARAGEDVDVPSEPPDAPGFDKLPTMLDRTRRKLVQTAAQPCYRDSWVPQVTNVDEPCPKRSQPGFDGKQAYYSSGFLPQGDEEGSTFELELDGDILPGTYHYYCNYHGPAMSGVVEVVPDREPIPTQVEVNRQAKAEAERYLDELAEVLERQRAGQDLPLPVVGGYPRAEDVADLPFFTALHNEFVPATIDAKVGEKVTWTFYGGHTLSFNVPKYFPVFTVREDGFVTFNRRAIDPVGWPGRPQTKGPAHVDAGEWDGTGGLRSTGGDFGKDDTFSITFTRPGTYPFACLIHPAMVGRVNVS